MKIFKWKFPRDLIMMCMNIHICLNIFMQKAPHPTTLRCTILPFFIRGSFYKISSCYLYKKCKKESVLHSYKLSIWNVSFWTASIAKWEDALPTERKWLMPLYNTVVKAPPDATQSCGHSVSGYLIEIGTVQGKTG